MTDPLLQSIFDRVAMFTWPAVGALFVILILKPFVPTIIEWIRDKKLMAKDKVGQMQSMAAVSFESRLAVVEANANKGLGLAQKIESNHLHDVENQFNVVNSKLEKMDDKIEFINNRVIVNETIQRERNNK